MRAVALIVSLSLLGCFPPNPQKRTYAKLTEGGMIVAGIGLNFLVNSEADCDAMAPMPGVMDNCKTKGAVLGDVGFGLILAGLVGFIATISTAEDDKPTPPPIDIKATPTATKPTPAAPPTPATTAAAVPTPAAAAASVAQP